MMRANKLKANQVSKAFGDGNIKLLVHCCVGPGDEVGDERRQFVLMSVLASTCHFLFTNAVENKVARFV